MSGSLTLTVRVCSGSHSSPPPPRRPRFSFTLSHDGFDGKFNSFLSTSDQIWTVWLERQEVQRKHLTDQLSEPEPEITHNLSVYLYQPERARGFSLYAELFTQVLNYINERDGLSLLLILTHSSTNFKLKNTLTRRIYLFWLKKKIKSLTWSVRKGHSDVWGVRKIQILSFLQRLQKKPKFNPKTTKFWTTFRFFSLN